MGFTDLVIEDDLKEYSNDTCIVYYATIKLDK